MKKLIFTIATVAAFSFANAQEAKQTTPAKKKTATTTEKTTKKETASGTGATTAASTEKNDKAIKGTESTTNAGTTGESMGAGTTETKPEDKKTRMAINEKGLPGEKKPAKSTTETKSTPK